MSLNSALNNYISSLQFGESEQDKTWNDEMFQKFSNLISDLSSEKQAVFIFGIHQKICHSGYDKLACEIMLQYGEDVLPQALEFFGKKNSIKVRSKINHYSPLFMISHNFQIFGKKILWKNT